MKLRDKVVLITGASSGIGRGVAVAMAREGAAVAVNFPSSAERADAEHVVGELEAIDARVIAIQGDVANESDCERMVRETQDWGGHLDVLVNNAGISHVALAHELPIAVWDRIIAVHLRGTFLCTRAALPGMLERGSGRIINTVSQLAYRGAAGLSAYTAAKMGVIAFTRSLALELGPRGINVNCVAPGATRTPLLETLPNEVIEGVRASIPLGRIAEVADIVPTYVFLASEDARHFQGQCLSPNGGDVFL